MEFGLKVILAIYLAIAVVFVIVSVIAAIRKRNELDFENPLQWTTFIIGMIVLSLVWIVVVMGFSEKSPKREQDVAEREARKEEQKKDKENE